MICPKCKQPTYQKETVDFTKQLHCWMCGTVKVLQVFPMIQESVAVKISIPEKIRKSKSSIKPAKLYRAAEIADILGCHFHSITKLLNRKRLSGCKAPYKSKNVWHVKGHEVLKFGGVNCLAETA